MLDKKLSFGFLLSMTIAALSARISALLDNLDFHNISTFGNYVSYILCIMAAIRSYSCIRL
jgi:hypothetical protein